MSQAKNYRKNKLIPVGIFILYWLIPLVYAAVSGQPEAGLTGFQAVKSAVSSLFCTKGYTHLILIFFIELGLVIFGLIYIRTRKQKLTWGNGFGKDGGLLLVFLLLLIVPFIIAWQTESSVCVRGKSFFWQSIFIEVFILATLAMSYNLMFGFTGVISFGHAAFFGIGAYGVGLLIYHLEWPLGISVIATLLLSIVLGLFVSVIGIRIRGLYFAIFTLAFAEIFFILSQNRIMTEITGAEDGFTFSVPDWINATHNRLTFYYLALLYLLFTYWFIRRLVNSPTGRIMGALRDNEDRALMLGYNTFWFKTLSIVTAGTLASGAGILRALLNKGASPNVLGLNFTMDPLLMTLIGGAGTYNGPVIGAFFLRLTEQVLRDATLQLGAIEINIGERWALILGGLFILSVLVFPAGIVGTWRLKSPQIRQGWQRLLKRFKVEQPDQ
jgi:branched-chain amino acid transport system permease protein